VKSGGRDALVAYKGPAAVNLLSAARGASNLMRIVEKA
jgi:hypothetical protein